VSSIRLFLTISIISAVVLANFLAALHGYQESMQEAEVLFDRKLHNYAEFISNNESIATAKKVSSSPPKSTQRLEEILYQIWDDQSRLLVQSSRFPSELIFKSKADKLYVNFDQARWRSITQYFPERKRWVVVLEKQDVRYNLAESVILKSVYPIIMAIPTIAILVFFIIHVGLRPIRKLANQVDKKRASNLSPIELENVPHELNRLTQRVNELLARLDDSLSREIRFASDAAHELRTPIAALNLQMKNLEDEQQDSSTEHSESIRALSDGVKRMSHLVEQILTLNRSSPELYAKNFAPIELAELLKSLVVELYPLVEQAQHEIEFDAAHDTDGRFIVQGDEFALSTLFKNLIVNAIKYTPTPGQIMIQLSKTGSGVSVRIMDSGLGIIKAERSRIFERFYRVDGDRNRSQIIGCGLGLAIVKQIAELHHAKLKLGDSHFKMQSGEKIDHGLTVELIFDESLELDV